MPCTSVRDNQAYTCDICGAKLSRPAHLQRHRLVHSTNTQESFHCQLCDKRFARKDVYQRHKRGVHRDSQTSRGTGRRKSCRRCIQYKLRCTRQVPCSACLNKGAECVFESRTVPRIAEDMSPEQSQGHSSDIAISANIHALSSNNTIDSTTSNSSIVVSTNATAVTLSQHDEESATCSETDTGVPGSGEVHIENLDAHHIHNSNSNYYNTLRHQEIGFFQPEDRRLQPDWEISNTTSFLSPPAEYSHLDEEGYCLTYSGSHESLDQNQNVEDQQQQIDQSLHIDSFDRNFFRSSRLDLLDWETDMSDKQTIPPDDQRSNGFSPTHAIQETENTIVNSDNSRASSLSAVPRSLFPPEHPPTINLPTIAEREGNETWPGILDRGGNEMWPFDYTSNKGFRKIILPPLRQILEQTVGERPAIEKTTLLDLIKVLSAPFIPSFNDSPALEALPAVTFLGQFMKIYFAEFHAVLPVIHIPTWRIEKCPTALLAAMACIGATYSTAEGSTEVSALLAEITQRALFWMGQSDSTAFRNPAYITASCFHQIYSLGSGNRRLYEIADASRGLLVTNLRGLGALSSESEYEEASTFEFQDLKKLDSDALEASWLRWRDKETEKRVAWSVFEFDCTVTTLTSKRGAFNTSELPPRLPCAESIWEAHSAHAWASMVTFCKSPPSGLPFYPLLREIMAQKSTLETVPAWAKRLCAQAIGRLLWDFREIEEASSPAVFGFPSLAASYQDTRLNLLRSLTVLHDSLSNPTCTSDLVNLNIACLGTHYCYLNSGNEAMDLVVYIFRNSGREKSASVSNGLIRAKEHLRNIFIHSPVKSRRQVCHAASIVGISRECSICTPCETIRIFMGFAFLLAFAKFFPFQRQEKDLIGPGDESGRAAIKLDELPWRRSAEDSHLLEKWVACGGRASLESVGNICDERNFEELKRVALETLRGLRVWGIAGKFCRIMKVFG